MAEFPPPLPLDPIVLDEVGMTVQSPLLFVYAVALIALIALYVAAVAILRSMPPKGRTRRTTHAAEGVDSSPVEESAPFSNLLGK
ncbi:MAG: hypothetical protein ACJLS2_02280 [Microcella pacifica]